MSETKQPARSRPRVDPTISVRDVAAAAQVSVGTVSNVLNRPDKVAPTTVVRVNAAIDALGFVRNDAARQLRAGRSRSIALILADVRNPFFTDIARAVEDRAAAAGFAVFLGDSDEDGPRERRYLDLFAEQRVHGLVISPVGEVEGRLAQLRSRGTASVVVDRRVDDLSFSSVSVDDTAGGRLAVEHLLERGHRRIAYLTPALGVRQVSERLAGALAAVSEQADATLEIVEAGGLTIAEGRRGGAIIAARDPALRPDAVFAANDLLALGALQGLLDAGARVPQDIALIGYDDISFAESAAVALSSIRQPTQAIGATAIDLLLAESAAVGDFERQAVVLQPEIVVRASSSLRRSR